MSPSHNGADPCSRSMQACKVAQSLLPSPNSLDEISGRAFGSHLLDCFCPVKAPCASLGDAHGLRRSLREAGRNEFFCLLT